MYYLTVLEAGSPKGPKSGCWQGHVSPRRLEGTACVLAASGARMPPASRPGAPSSPSQPAGAPSRLSDTPLLLPCPAFKDPGDHIGPTWIILDNPFTLKSADEQR